MRDTTALLTFSTIETLLHSSSRHFWKVSLSLHQFDVLFVSQSLRVKVMMRNQSAVLEVLQKNLHYVKFFCTVLAR